MVHTGVRATLHAVLPTGHMSSRYPPHYTAAEHCCMCTPGSACVERLLTCVQPRTRKHTHNTFPTMPFADGNGCEPMCPVALAHWAVTARNCRNYFQDPHSGASQMSCGAWTLLPAAAATRFACPAHRPSCSPMTAMCNGHLLLRCLSDPHLLQPLLRVSLLYVVLPIPVGRSALAAVQQGWGSKGLLLHSGALSVHGTHSD